MAKPETTACWYKPKVRNAQWKSGYFHQWGTELASVEGDGNFTIGIIEDSRTHEIVCVMPECVHFGSDPDSP